MTSRRFMLIFTLLAMPLLGGSQCAFFFSSGGGSSHNHDDNNQDEKSEVVVIVNGGNLSGPVVAGVNYQSGALSGITGNKGEFQYEAGKTIRFFVGDIKLGGAVQGKSVITPADLVPDGTPDTPTVNNIVRLLQSLDSNPGDEVITIPESVRAAANRSNQSVAAAIEFLDFSDDTAFVNAAAHLVAVLTGDYPFTAALADADTARASLTKSIAKEQN